MRRPERQSRPADLSRASHQSSAWRIWSSALHPSSTMFSIPRVTQRPASHILSVLFWPLCQFVNSRSGELAPVAGYSGAARTLRGRNDRKVERNLWYTKAGRALGPEIQRIETHNCSCPHEENLDGRGPVDLTHLKFQQFSLLRALVQSLPGVSTYSLSGAPPPTPGTIIVSGG